MMMMNLNDSFQEILKSSIAKHVRNQRDYLSLGRKQNVNKKITCVMLIAKILSCHVVIIFFI